MDLKSFHVQNFQSVLDSRPVDVSDITCLVGKNEAGKSALLKALYKLDPIRDEDSKYDFVDDYPRLDVSDYEDEVKRGVKPPATVVRATYALDGETKRKMIELFGPSFLEGDECEFTKDYANKRSYVLKANEASAVEFLCRSVNSDLREKARNINSPKELLAVLQTQAADPAVAAIIPILQKAGGETFGSYAWSEIVRPNLPKFLYFDEYYQMRGAENIEALKQRVAAKTLKPSDHPILGLIELAGLNFDQMLNPQRTQELKNRLEGAGNRLTQRVLKYWSQNRHLQMRFDVRPGKPGDPEDMRGGTNIWGEVYDTRHFVSTSIGTRSRGFVWFFSFVAWYSQLQRRGENVILLLDEPGLTLHGRAQGDLLAYFEAELKPHHQVIYTTHSPFMVDPKKFERVRIVQDKSIDDDDLPKEEQGTKVFTDIFEASDDSLFPLQGALGYDIHQTLFIGPNNVMVEGASDLLYLWSMSDILERRDRERLSAKWTLSPCGGAAKVPTIVRLLTGQRGLKIATLVDIQNRDRQMIENLYRTKILKKSNVLTFADFTGAKEADIEDMFDPDFYLLLVNGEFKANLGNPIAVADLSSKAARILQKLEDYFQANPMTKAGFNHYRPARYFAEHIAALEPNLSDATIDRFEAAFAALNKLL